MSVKISTKILAILLFLGVLMTALPVFGQNITQAYSSDVILRRGMIVGLSEQNLRKVEPINSSQYERMHGVVVGSNDVPLMLDNQTETVYVANAGRFTVLVSNQAGNIDVGDFITVSAISGIGMKASNSDPIVLGKAIESFNASDSNQSISQATVKDAGGNEKSLQIGQILVDVNISKNPLLQTDNSLPSALRKASELIAGRPISSTRVYLGLIVLLIASALAASMLYSAVRSAIIAVGRNPLGKKVILKSLVQVVGISVMIFLSGIFGVYLLLKL